MRLLLLLAALASCDRGNESDTPRGPTATGSMVFTARAEADVFLATESEVVRSSRLIDRANEQFGTKELTADAVRVKRRPGTMILDVSVSGADPARAATLCNVLMQSYAQFRMESGLVSLQQKMQALASQLEQTPNDAALEQKLKDLELERTTRENDVRLLEPCRARSTGSGPRGGAP